ncbi:2CS histidine protein kinase [Bifidobacterium margollesii]|uniref:histidine kinase n=2 Tax=Bifidobacterium margollesii TaxID=2020964 RepID=A0A2N5JAV0_9BIFI|nr:2CS histidine protein kinase [Bifidobacterium margollesii]
MTVLHGYDQLRIGVIVELGLYAMAAMALPFVPRVSGWFVGSLWFVGSFNAVVDSPWSPMLLVWLSALTISHRHAVEGVPFAVLALSGSVVQAVRSSDYDTYTTPALTAMIGIMVAMVFIGSSLYWNTRNRKVVRALDDRLERERAALRIHDSISNDLAYLIMRIDQSTTTNEAMNDRAPEALSDLREVAVTALNHTYEVIDALEDDARSGNSSGVFAGTVDDVGDAVRGADLGKSLWLIVENGDGRLHSLGFRGDSWLDDSGVVRIGRNQRTLVESFVAEVYGNIARHASPEGGYAVRICVKDDELVVTVSDRPKDDSGDSSVVIARSGRGMRSHEALFRSQGGSLTVDSRDGFWAMTAVIPLRSLG